MRKPHLLHVVIDHQWLGYEIECPYEPDDPERSCVLYDEDDLTTPLNGCGVQGWLDSGYCDDPIEWLGKFPRQRTTGPIAVGAVWEDEGYLIEPWADQPTEVADDE